VALVDILGFKEIVRTSELLGLAKQLAGTLGSCVGLAVTHSQKIVKDGVARVAWAKRMCGYFQFSDTILLYSRDSSLRGCFNLVVSAWHLVRSLFAIRFPCRGAVVFGPLAMGPEKGLFVGQSVIDAYELTEAQDWGGAVLSPSLVATFPQLKELAEQKGTIPNLLLCPYRVPFKSGAKLPFEQDRELLCLNWRFNLVVEKGTKWLFRDPQDEGALAKIRNTLEFCRLLRAQGRVYADGPNFPTVLRPFYVGHGGPGANFPHGDEW